MLAVEYSYRTILLPGLLFVVAHVFAVLRYTDGGLLNPWMLGLTVVAFGVGAAIGAFTVVGSDTRIDSRGLARRRRGGKFKLFKRLERDQRSVTAKRRLCIQRPDGKIEKTEIAKRRIRRDDWELLAQQYPGIDATESPRPGSNR